MHELSIAMSMVDIALETAEKNGGGKVIAVYLKLGALAGVVKEALEFSWMLACADTAIEGSRLVIEEVPVVVRCPSCESDQRIASISNLKCPVCGSRAPSVLNGKELEVTALEIA